MQVPRVRMVSCVAVVVGLCLAVPLFGRPQVAAAVEWPLMQSFAKSADVHSPTFFSAKRGFALIGNRLLQTNDGGGRWTLTSPAEWTSRMPRALSFADPLHGWVVGDAFVLGTSDGGAHWAEHRLAGASAGAATGGWRAVCALGAGHAVAAGDAGLLAVTADGGASWHAAQVDVPAAPVADPQAFSIAALAFPDALHGWAVGADAAGRSLVLATADGGLTWRAQATPAERAFSSVSFADATHGWATTPVAVVRTDDGGATWRAVRSPVGAKALADGAQASLVRIAATGADHACLASSDAPVVWETADGGESWTPTILSAETGGVTGLVALDASHTLATGLSLPAGERLTSGRIWSRLGIRWFSADGEDARVRSRRSFAGGRASGSSSRRSRRAARGSARAARR